MSPPRPTRGRCCRRRWFEDKGTAQEDQSVKKLKLVFPETPLILAGAVGGPILMFLLTPLRNALTLASHDSSSSAFELYRSAFEAGGWTGGLAPMVMSCPQFCVMGPLYHFLKDTYGIAFVAVVAVAAAETFLTYGAQSLNNQLAYNQEQMISGGAVLQVPLAMPLIPYGPAVSLHFCRNLVTMWGLRMFAEPCEACLRQLVWACGLKRVHADVLCILGVFLATACSACISGPLHQAYAFAVTSEAYFFGGPLARASEIMSFYERAYLLHNAEGNVIGLSNILLRDLTMRAAYAATLSSIFVAIERITVLAWKSRRRD